MHYEKSSGDFKWFSRLVAQVINHLGTTSCKLNQLSNRRKATDYTDLYGENKNSLDKLSGQISSCLNADR